MPLPGGPADKIGNRYETWWTVQEMLRVLDGTAGSIRIEDPGIDKAEFTIRANGCTEYHQAKLPCSSGKWNLASLKPILEGIFPYLDGNSDRFVFVSGSDAPELREMASRARDAASFGEFENSFLDSKAQKENFAKVCEFLPNAEECKVHDLLRRIDVNTIDEQLLAENVRIRVRLLFLEEGHTISEMLRILACESIHKTLDKKTIVEHLKGRGIVWRCVTSTKDAAAHIDEITQSYLATGRRTLIGGSVIPRTQSQEILRSIIDASEPRDFVIVGTAGTGKTACIIEVAEVLRNRQIPVLILRVDRLQVSANGTPWYKQLGLEESPALVLGAAAQEHAEQVAVLVIDQLDALSTTSGRNPEIMDDIGTLLEEIRVVRERKNLHIIVACRKFDWENDHHLRTYFPTNANVEIGEFSEEDVERTLRDGGYAPKALQPYQLKLLRLPQNLFLFLDSGFTVCSSPIFSTTKELLDRYWETKRNSAKKRSESSVDYWIDVISLLSSEMTKTQRLSVAKEKLDQFESYAKVMTSEGVLSFDGKQYGFGHESFFDYCFARTFCAGNEPLVGFLTGTEQHLFRRAQVRQVLVYLRDADYARYCQELQALLDSPDIRVHLKDLALASVASVPDPKEGEWNVLQPYLNRQLESLKTGALNQDKLSLLVWQRIFTAESWFPFVHARNVIPDWLNSESPELVNTAVSYLRLHQRKFSEEVAVLLEPYVGKGEVWRQRFVFVMRWAEHTHSRKFFELFLRVIDDGTLDNARDAIASNGTFWTMLHGVDERSPQWGAEVVEHWLRRRQVIVSTDQGKEGRPNWRSLFNNDSFAGKCFQKIAENASPAFVQHVLPVILDIAEAARRPGNGNPPFRDDVWPLLFAGDPIGPDAWCLEAMRSALVALAYRTPDCLAEVVDDLRSRETYTSNYLLLSLYAADPMLYANEATELICGEPWRLHCGFSDSPFWVSRQLITAIFPYCSQENQQCVETLILGFVPDFERSTMGQSPHGGACYALLSAISSEMRSRVAQARFVELERKFGAPSGPPRGIRIYTVRSPISEETGSRMSDEQWLAAISKYDSEDRPGNWEEPDKGGASQLAVMLKSKVCQEPERFAHLALRFPCDVNPVYLRRLLDGLKDSNVSMELRIDVCRKAYAESREACGREIADVLGASKELLPTDAIEMLQWLATEHPDPSRESWGEQAFNGKAYYGGDIFTAGMNTTRGRAALAICDLTQRDPAYTECFGETLDRLISDTSLSVRACAASILIPVAQADESRSLSLFNQLVQTDVRLLGTHYVSDFIAASLPRCFDSVLPVIERMLRSERPEISQVGSQLGSLARLHGNNVDELIAEALAGSSRQRLGVAKVAANNIALPDCTAWCMEQLSVLFCDNDTDVREEAASCFRQLEGKPLDDYGDFICRFCDTPAFESDSFPLLYLLEHSTFRLPGIACIVCQKFLSRFSDEAKDISTSRAGDAHSVVNLIFRTYHQHQSDDWAGQCLDLIDLMCLEGIQEVGRGFKEFER